MPVETKKISDLDLLSGEFFCMIEIPDKEIKQWF